MKTLSIQGVLLVTVTVCGCSGDRPFEPETRPATESTASLDDTEVGPRQSTADSSRAGNHEAAQHPASTGPLAEDWQFVACLRNDGNPLDNIAILRNQRGHLVQIRVAERVVRRDEFARELFVDSVDDDAFVYRLPENVTQPYRLWRVSSGDPVSVSARTLVSFVGRASGLPIIYDGRTGYAERTIDVARDTTVLDESRLRALLESSEMPLIRGTLDSGRSVLFWGKPPSTSLEQPVEASPNVLAPGWRRLTRDSTLDFGRRAVDIDAGGISVAEFLRFLSDLLGRPLFVSPDVAAVEANDIDTISPIESADAELVRALLRANGVSVLEQTLPGSGEVLVATLSRSADQD